MNIILWGAYNLGLCFSAHMMWAIIWTMGNIHFVYLTWSIWAKPIVVDCGHLSAIFPFNISYCQHFTMFPGSARGLIKMKNKKLYTLSHHMVWKMIRSAPVLSAAPSTYLCITISIAIIILSLSKFIHLCKGSYWSFFWTFSTLSTFYDVSLGHQEDI